MPRPTPSFPGFDDWKRMSEREQDALLDRLETAKRRGSLAIRILIGLACVAVVLATGLVLMTLG